MKSRAYLYLGGASLLTLLAGPAFAQSGGGAESSATQAAGLEEVVVTGSRIQSTGYARPTPVTVVTAAQLSATQPAGIAQALIELPQFASSSNPRTNASNNVGGGRGNFLNLRNLGANRSLVLLDGVRIPPTTADGQVSVDVVPDLLVQRVDVVTGGVSAVYGSDAVAGIVNFILDKRFAGVKGEVSGGVSDRNDMGSYRAAVAAGSSFMGQRGHVLFSVSRQDAGGITKQDLPLRRFNYDAVALYAPGSALPGGGVAGATGSANNPLYIRPNIVSATSTAGSNIQIGPAGAQGLAFTADAAGTPYVRDNGAFGLLNAQVGGSGSVLRGDATIQTPYRNDQVFGRVSYDLSPSTTVFLEAQLQRSRFNYQIGDNFGTVPIYADNPYIPTVVRTAINAAAGNLPVNGYAPAATACGRGTSPVLCLGVQGTLPEVFGRPYQRERTETYLARTGFTTDLTDKWKLDVTYVFGQVRQKVTEFNPISNIGLYSSVDAVRDPATGNVVCRVTLTNPGLYPGCAPWNPFGVQTASPQLSAWIHSFQGNSTSAFEILNITHDFVGNITGELFNTWAGPVGFAIGGEYRTGVLRQSTNSNPSLIYNKTGVRGIAPTAPPWIVTNIGNARGSNEIWEVNGEVEVPLARDVAFARSLSVSAAARYTNYSTSGGVETWKVGATWEPIRDIRLRVSKSRDIRAPTLFDLYAGLTSTSVNFVDIHCNCRLPTGVTQLGGGNPNLKPEIGDTFTIGAVLSPSFLPRFTASIDYYSIELKDALTSFTIDQVMRDCEDSNGTSPTCSLITRPNPFSDRSTANAATAIFATRINSALLTTRGFDLDAAYSVPLGEASEYGGLNFRLFANYTRVLKSQASASSPLISNIGTTDSAQPKIKATLSVNYLKGPYIVSARVRYIGKLKTGPGTPLVPAIYADPELPEITYTDLSISRKFTAAGADFDAYLTVNNVFDKDPPVFTTPSAPGLNYPTIVSLYDITGRYYTAGIRFKF